MQPGVTSLNDLRRFYPPDQQPPWHACIVQPELNGGRTTSRALDALDAAPQATALTISGLDQTTLEQLVLRFGQRLTALHLWKCPQLADLSPLEDLRGLTRLAIFWNQRATGLWDLRRTPHLRGLHLADFVRLDRLDDLTTGAAVLEDLWWGNANLARHGVRTLEPLAHLQRLRTLAFNAKTVGDGRVQALAALQQLEQLDFPASQFTVEQLAWLRARLPATVSGDALQAMRPLQPPLRRGTQQLDWLVNGKRMPLLSSETDARRIAQYRARFDAQVAHFRAHPQAEPAPNKP